MKYCTSKLILFSAFFILFYFNTFGQKIDSLSKYSYFLYAPTKEIGVNAAGQEQNKSKIATVFFIRKNNKLYLFSAAHSILGLDYNNRFESDFPDTFYLRLYKPNSNEMFDLKFNAKQLIGSGADISFYKTHYDIIYFPMVLPEYDIKSIESFVSENEPIQKGLIEEAVVYGFAAKDGGDLTKSTIDYATLKKVTLNSSSMLYNSFIIKSGMPTYGFSGSPLFLKTNNSKIIFGGVAVAGTDKVLTFVPPQVILEIFNKL